MLRQTSLKGTAVESVVPLCIIQTAIDESLDGDPETVHRDRRVRVFRNRNRQTSREVPDRSSLAGYSEPLIGHQGVVCL